VVFGLTAETTPHYIYQLSLTDPVIEFSGHDFDCVCNLSDFVIVSQTDTKTTIRALRGYDLCDITLHKSAKVAKKQKLKLPALPHQPTPWWSCEHVAIAGKATLVARCNSSPRYNTLGAAQIALVEGGKCHLLANLHGMNVLHLSSTSDSVLAILVDRTGKYHLYHCSF
jgi:hypothetical protein